MYSDSNQKYYGTNNQIQILDEIVIKKGLYMPNGCLQVINDEAQILFRDNQNENTQTLNQKIIEIVNRLLSQKVLNNNIIFNSSVLDVDLSNLSLTNDPLLIVDKNMIFRIIFNDDFLWTKQEDYPLKLKLDYNGSIINEYEDHLADILSSPNANEEIINSFIFKYPDSNKYIITFNNLSNNDIQLSQFNNTIEMRILFKGIIFE